VWEEVKQQAQTEKDTVDGIKTLNKVKYLGDDLADEELHTAGKKQIIAYEEKLDEALDKYYANKAKDVEKARKEYVKQEKKKKKKKGGGASTNVSREVSPNPSPNPSPRPSKNEGE